MRHGHGVPCGMALLVGLIVLLLLALALLPLGCGAAQDLAQKSGLTGKAGGDLEQESTQESTQQQQEGARSGDVGDVEGGDVQQTSEYHSTDPRLWGLVGVAALGLFLLGLLLDQPPMDTRTKLILQGIMVLCLLGPMALTILLILQ